jgi:hypothetical protein
VPSSVDRHGRSNVIRGKPGQRGYPLRVVGGRIESEAFCTADRKRTPRDRGEFSVPDTEPQQNPSEQSQKSFEAREQFVAKVL